MAIKDGDGENTMKGEGSRVVLKKVKDKEEKRMRRKKGGKDGLLVRKDGDGGHHREVELTDGLEKRRGNGGEVGKDEGEERGNGS